MRPSYLALLPESRFLLAAGRTFEDEAGTWGKNAVVYSPEGRPESAHCVGDDIDYLILRPQRRNLDRLRRRGIYGGRPQSIGGLAGWNTDGVATWGPRGRLPVTPLGGSAAATEGGLV
ncbi:hypothetical protein ACWDYJ_11915 [Streptomyces sp. NPDC003042]